MIGKTTELGPCQVRSKTDRPCPHQAVMEIRSIPYCEACAREQEAYFDIGELTMRAQGLASDPELTRRIAEAGKHQGGFLSRWSPRTGKVGSST